MRSHRIFALKERQWFMAGPPLILEDENVGRRHEGEHVKRRSRLHVSEWLGSKRELSPLHASRMRSVTPQAHASGSCAWARKCFDDVSHDV